MDKNYTSINNKDLKVGMKISVIEWTRHLDYSYMGDVLEIKAFSDPFLVVKRLNGFKSTFSLDTRAVRLKELSKEYVEAILQDEKHDG